MSDFDNPFDIYEEDDPKECSQCGERKPLSEFNLVGRGRPYHRSICKSCEKLNNKEYRDEHRAEIQDQANEYYQEHKKDIIVSQREKRQALRNEVIDAYGGKCACCGETHREFLSIDHIEGGGGSHRRTLAETGNYSRKLYPFLKAEGFPKDKYRLLCMNCNWARMMYGHCPHGNGI